jgi:hypothetical protein
LGNPPKQNSYFVAAMEQFLDVYERPYNKVNLVVFIDETPKQLIKEVRKSITMKPEFKTGIDYEYSRSGVCNVFMVSEPLAGKRYLKLTQSWTKKDWAFLVKYICDRLYPKAKIITMVMDILASHRTSVFCETFAPDEAKRLWDRLEFIFTPKQGAWLNMVEIEQSV